LLDSRHSKNLAKLNLATEYREPIKKAGKKAMSGKKAWKNFHSEKKLGKKQGFLAQLFT
jgi:hypothetical protein